MIVSVWYIEKHSTFCLYFIQYMLSTYLALSYQICTSRNRFEFNKIKEYLRSLFSYLVAELYKQHGMKYISLEKFRSEMIIFHLQKLPATCFNYLESQAIWPSSLQQSATLPPQPKSAFLPVKVYRTTARVYCLLLDYHRIPTIVYLFPHYKV